jgi:hypothetical protein
MKLSKLPKAESALDPKFLKNLGIKSYDADNLYPQNVHNIVLSSKTGRGCLERYIDFIEGRGIASEALAGFIVNLDGETLADLHGLVSGDLGEYDGFAIHVNYDIDANIVSLHHIPFENARICECDEEGVVRKVALHPDWSGKLTRNGKVIKITQETVDYLDVFNPDPAVVLAQIQEAGGPQFFKGQVYYYSREGFMRYPYARYHSVLSDMSTDEGLSNIMLRNVRNNFLPAGAFVRLKSQGSPYSGDDSDDEPQVETEEYAEDLAGLQGDTEALKILDITVESKEEMPEFINMQGNNYDKDFTQTATEVKDCIYSAFGQEGWLSLRNGKVGFSGTLVADVERDYAKRQIKTQKALTRCYKALLSVWTPTQPLPADPDSANLAVIPLVDLTTPTKA